MKWIMVTGFAVFTAASTLAANPDHRIEHAASAFQDVMRTPDKGIPRDLLERANCIVIVPGLKKGAFGFGGKYGRGFATCRGRGGWSAPGGVRIEGASFGLQLGGSSTDVFLLVMNEKGMSRLLADKFTLAGEAAVASSPVGGPSVTGSPASRQTMPLGCVTGGTYMGAAPRTNRHGPPNS